MKRIYSLLISDIEFCKTRLFSVMDRLSESSTFEEDVCDSQDSTLDIIETSLITQNNIIPDSSTDSEDDNVQYNKITIEHESDKNDYNGVRNNSFELLHNNIVLGHNMNVASRSNSEEFNSSVISEDSTSIKHQNQTDMNDHCDYSSKSETPLESKYVSSSNYSSDKFEVSGKDFVSKNLDCQAENSTSYKIIGSSNKLNQKSPSYQRIFENQSFYLEQDETSIIDLTTLPESPGVVKEGTSALRNNSSPQQALSEGLPRTLFIHSPDIKNEIHDKNNTEQEHESLNFNILNSEAEQLLAEQERLKFEINELHNNIKDKENAIKSVSISSLPDKGLKLKVSLGRDKRNLDTLNEQYQRVLNRFNMLYQENRPEKIKQNENEFTDNINTLPSANIQDMGKRALETFRTEQSLTIDSLRKLHNSLNMCPSEDVLAVDPVHLKIPLMGHQKQALTWLLWREKQSPSGGILADDMGLGKTLTMLSLIVSQNEAGLENEMSDCDDEDEDSNDPLCRAKKYYKGGTLIICPSSLLGQWELEIQSKIKSQYLSYQIYHGANREKKTRRLAKPDIIITSYSIVRVEAERNENQLQSEKYLPESVLYSIKWQRIILDEAHVIRNHKSKTACAIYQLKSKSRWALTGTPVHNKTQDFFSLIKFLRCKPFDDISVWKKWVEARDESGTQRMNMLTKSLMLRRTKAILIDEGKLGTLPERLSEDIFVQLNTEESSLYELVSNFSKTLLGQLLYQKAEKENLFEGFPVSSKKLRTIDPSNNPFSGHPALDKLFKKVGNMENVKTHVILVLLLRLRQLCCHPALMKSMIEKETVVQDALQEENSSDIELTEKMSSMTLGDKKVCNFQEDIDIGNQVWDVNNPIFNSSWKSSKIQAIIDLLENNLLKTNDKIVIVSQWTSMLELLQEFLKKIKHCECDCLSGKVPIPQRMQIVNNFNKESSSLRVLLLSLTAGGTGLNLIGGNHLILTDLHWNPQLEAQACDRIYRVGQKKPVRIYKFICSETIEERIQVLQQQKMELADNVLSGGKRIQVSHLSLNDLKMLFNVT